MSDVITVDGPVASGKSTVGFLFAQKIGYQFIDTGLLYRIDALLSKRKNIDVSDADQCARLLEDIDVRFKTENGVVKVYIDSEDITLLLKTPEIDQLTPVVAAHHKVREVVKHLQRKIAQFQSSVIAGRDIGSEIFPHAPLKFFVTASVEARAKRRYEQQVKMHPEIRLEDIEKDIRQRDLKDSTREASPMRIPEDAIVVDTSDLDIEEVVNRLYSAYKRI